MEAISDRDVLEAIRPYSSEEYLRRARANLDTGAVGRSLFLFYPYTGGRGNYLDARRIGRAMGLFGRIYDDVMDGDACEPVEDRETYLERLLETFREGGIPETDDAGDDIMAFAAADRLHEFFSDFPEVHEEMSDTMEEMFSYVRNEDKSHEEGYERYLKANGELLGKLYVEALQVLPGYELEEEEREMGGELSRIFLMLDHILDDDVNMRDADLREKYLNTLENFRQHGPLIRFYTWTMFFERPLPWKVLVKALRTYNKIFKA